MQLQVGVKVLFKNEQGEVLILKRSQPYPGDTECKWDIPGGRINTDEALLDGLKREIREETSLTLVGIPRFIFVQDIFQGVEKHVVRVTYLGIAEGEIKLDPLEHQEYRWLSIEDALKTYHDIYLTPVLNLLINQKFAS